MGSNIDQVASVNGKDVVLLAGRDLQADAAVIAASGDATLSAGRDVRLGVVQEYFRQEIRWADDKGGSNWVSRLTGPNFVDRANGAHGTNEVGVNRAVVSGSKEVATQVSGNSIRIQAGQDVTSKGAQVVAEGALQVEAGRDMRIGTANVSASARDQGQRSSSGILSATTVRTDDASSTSREAGSTFSGDTVLVRSGNDVNVKGSQIVSTQGTTILAGNDVNIVAASESSSQRNFRQETKSGVMGAGIGVTVGSRMQSRDVDRNSETASASTIGSVQGDVGIVAGNRYTQVGSDVLAPGGDIDIVARTVSILAAQQSSRTVTEDKFRQQGVTVAVISPVLSAVQTVQQMAEAATKTRNGRVQALAAANMGFAGKQAYDAISAGQGSTINDKPNQIATGPADAKGKVPSRDASSADKVGGINLAFSIGGSSSNSRSEQSSKTVRGSVVAAGDKVHITAQGGGKDSDILIQGSDIKAGVNASLQAENENRLLADQNTSAQNSSNQSKSGSVGFSIGTDGFLVNANASGSRGRGDGNDVEQVNTHVDAGNKVELRSGTDTTLRGAVVAGRRVEIDAGTGGHGDLNIESLQDSSNTKSKQQGFGASVSVGAGKMNGSVNLSHSRVEGEFASANEQSGIRAGDEGFQVRVAGNTDLKGSKIASTDKAAIEGRNSLSTETLTQSDIRNRSRYKAESISVGTGLDGAKGSLAGTGIGIGSSSGNESSVTRSGISAADVRIKDDLAQQAKTGKSAAETIASINTEVSSARDTSGKLNKQWDAQALQEDVQAQARIMEAFGRNASREIGRYATTKVNELDRKIESASEAERPALIAERDKWSEGGFYRTALHTAAGALSGGATGGAGALTASTVMPEFSKLIAKMALPAPVRQGLEQVTAAAIGSVAGGSAGLAAAVNAEANNRQLHQSERDWAKSQASKYRKYLKDATRESISDEEAYQRLLSAGYAVVDAAAERGGKSDELAKRFIAENKTAGLFSASVGERNNPFLNGNKDGSWTPEQQARYGLRNPSEWVDFRIAQALIFTRRTCLSASECGAKVTNITLAVAALEQKKALYWDEPLIRREIDAQKSSLVNGITTQDIQRAKLAEADRSTLLELLAVADAPVLVGKIGEVISHSGRRTQPSVEQVSTSLAEANRASGERLLQHLARSQKSDPLIGMVISVGREPVTVTAEANIGGKIILDTNQTARALDKADPTKKTLISDLIPSGQPNSNMANAHAEIAVIQKAFDLGLTKGKEMTIIVRGERVCSYCISADNILAAANRSGLNKLQIIDTEAGVSFVWRRGEKVWTRK